MITTVFRCVVKNVPADGSLGDISEQTMRTDSAGQEERQRRRWTERDTYRYPNRQRYRRTLTRWSRKDKKRWCNDIDNDGEKHIQIIMETTKEEDRQKYRQWWRKTATEANAETVTEKQGQTHRKRRKQTRTYQERSRDREAHKQKKTDSDTLAKTDSLVLFQLMRLL